MKATPWARMRMFVDRHAAKIAVAAVVAGASAGLAGVRWEADQRADAVATETRARADAIAEAAAERRAQICDESRNLRALVSELIDTAVGEPGTSLPLTTLDSFDALPVSVQTYLHELAAVAAESDGDEPDLAERLRDFQDTRLGDLPEFCTSDGAT